MKKLFLLPVALLLCFSAHAKAAEQTITMMDRKFSENDVKLQPGDTLVFANADKINYNVQIKNDRGEINDDGLQKPGDMTKNSFSSAGEYEAYCAIHPEMRLKIIVK